MEQAELDVLFERKKQTERWGAQHDNCYKYNELSSAASAKNCAASIKEESLNERGSSKSTNF